MKKAQQLEARLGFYSFCQAEILRRRSNLEAEWSALLKSTKPEDILQLQNYRLEEMLYQEEKCFQKKRKRRTLAIDAYFEFAKEYRPLFSQIYPEWGSKRITNELMYQFTVLDGDAKQEYKTKAKWRKLQRLPPSTV